MLTELIIGPYLISAKNFITASGYTGGTAPGFMQITGSTSGTSLVTTYVTETVATWVPPVAGSSGSPAIPATPTVRNYLTNSNWDSHARSIVDFPRGSFIEYTTSGAPSGVFVGFGLKGQDSDPLSRFTFGVLVDPLGARVFENGSPVHTLKGLGYSSTVYRVVIQPNGSVVYLAIHGTDIGIYKSTIKAPNTTLYAYGKIYTSSERVNEAKKNSGKVLFGRA